MALVKAPQGIRPLSPFIFFYLPFISPLSPSILSILHKFIQKYRKYNANILIIYTLEHELRLP